MNERTKAAAEERLSWSVTEALRRTGPISARCLERVQVVTRGGTVVLKGLLASEAHRHLAARLARGVPGVVEVIDEMVTDQDLERRVAVALASDEGTRHYRIVVRVSAGVARLHGVVPSAEIAEKARTIALTVPGLVDVDSRLRTVPAGTPVLLTWQNSVEGRPLTAAGMGVGSAGAESGPDREMAMRSPKPAGMEGTA